MRKTYFGDLPAYQFHLLQKFSDQIDHAIFTRKGGVSAGAFAELNVRFGIGDSEDAVKENRKRICHALKYDISQLVSADQTHSKNVQIVDEEFLRFRESNRELSDTDAFVTNVAGVLLMAQVADCQTILMYDRVANVVAAAHAGWKGLVQDVSGATIDVLKQRYGSDPANILVGISPSLGPCCAFFSNPEQELPKNFHPFIDGQKRVNLWDFSIAQLQSHGIRREHIELARTCTRCSGKNSFYSFRGERGICGRFAGVIGRKC